MPPSDNCSQSESSSQLGKKKKEGRKERKEGSRELKENEEGAKAGMRQNLFKLLLHKLF